MKLASVKINNYRGLKDLEIPLSNFACLIGPNNSGKSSVLQCLSLAVTGTKLSVSDYYDPQLSVRIAVTLNEIDQHDFEKVTDEQHRKRFENLVVDGSLTLVRSYEPSAGKSSLSTLQHLPTNPLLRKDGIKQHMTGNRAEALRTVVVGLIPELDAVLAEKPTQGDVNEQIDILRIALVPDDLVEEDAPLSTGLDKSILPLLPEIVYIPAVKDVNDEIKTTDSATFGKLLGILFDEIAEEVSDVEATFVELQRKLSRINTAAGVVDDRLPAVKRIEETIERYVQHNFPRVTLNIDVPAPQLRTILRSAEITADDGFLGPIASKGDGLKRAVAFAILQSFAELKGGFREGEHRSRSSYILLFEEPELYLHPQGQRQLFDALAVFAKQNIVVVTTHSPLFFSADDTATFCKLSKATAEDDAPVSIAHSVSLATVSTRDQFQMVGFENNNAALFADHVVLIEGDSDLISLSQIVKMINKDWSKRYEVMFVRVSGKGSIQRYREFFELFNVEVSVICDLDTLFNGFEKLSPQKASVELRSKLLEEIDKLLPAPDDMDASGTSIKDIRKGASAKALWQGALGAHQLWKEEPSNWENVEVAMEALFDRLVAPGRYSTLQKSDDVGVLKAKSDLLAQLASEGTYVLARGCIEDYYPDTVTGTEKIEKALDFCSRCEVMEFLDHQELVEGQISASKEFRSIFAGIYGQ